MIAGFRWSMALVAALFCSLPAEAQTGGATTGKTWYVNGLTGNDYLPGSGENMDGSAGNQLRTLGHAFRLVQPGDTVVVDGPSQAPVVGPPGFDVQPNLFYPINVSGLTLQCRDPDFAINGGLQVNGDNMVVFNCVFQYSGNNPAFYAGSSNGHYFENVTFNSYGNNSGVGFQGSGNSYSFLHSKFYNLSYGLQFDAPGTGSTVQFNTFYYGSYAVLLGGGIGTFKYNIVNRQWGVYLNGSTYVPGKYDIDENWYYVSNGSAYGGPDEFQSYNDTQFAGYFMLQPTSPAINSVYDPSTGVRITPGCCDVVTVQGNGGNSDFSNWQAWSGGAWTPITNSSTPVYESGSQLYLNTGVNCAFVRGNPVQGLPGAKLKQLRVDRTVYYSAQPGYRSDIDSDPNTPAREIEVRAVSCGADQGMTNGFSTADTSSGAMLSCGASGLVAAPPGLFYKVINGSTLASNQTQPSPPTGLQPLTMALPSADSGAPCWQAQLFLSRVLP